MIEVRLSSSTVSSFYLLSYFSFLYFPIVLLFISPISVLFTSIYNLFGLHGREAPFTHSLTH